MNCFAMNCYILIALFLAGDGEARRRENPAGFPPEQCYKCTQFNEEGFGYVENPDHTKCCQYYECWKDNGVNSLGGVLRTCPRGTWFNRGVGGRGAPCTSSKPYPECDTSCGTEPTAIMHSSCQLWPDPIEPESFGTIENGVFTRQGGCAFGTKFDHGTCTCEAQQGDCFCMLLLDFYYTDNQDFSCMQGDIYTSGDPVYMDYDSNYGYSGLFSNSLVTASLFRGLYAGCWLRKLTITAWFNAFEADSATMQGIICHDNCDDDDTDHPSFCVTVGQNKVVGTIGEHSVEYGPISSNTWYNVVMTYNRKLKRKNLKLYVFTFDEHTACLFNNQCSYVDSADTDHACIEPRECGVTIGFTGSNSTQGFFSGQMTTVEVYHGLNLFGCEYM